MRNPRFHHINQRTGYLLATQVHTDGMGLHDSRLTINIDNQSRQVVTLAMYQTIRVVIGIVGNTNGLTHFQSRRKAGMPEFIVNPNVRERQHTHGNRAFLIVTHSDEIARISQYTHHITLIDTLVNLKDGTREYPRMKSPETLFLTPFKPNFFVHRLSLLSVRNRLSAPVASTLRRA